jgi:hypothetical protein
MSRLTQRLHESLISGVNYFIQGDAEKSHAQLTGCRDASSERVASEKRRSIMKAILITIALSAVLVAPALAQQAPQTQTRQGWGSKVHVYAPDYYAQQRGNSNTNPDFQLTRER